MSGLTINIISFDIPYPANYGGAIDIFYKIKTLHKQGVEIILHCFKYNKPEQPELERYCKQVIYYPRKRGIFYLFSRLPYIVITRKNKLLLANLQKNKHPILFEGLHSCYFLNSKELQNRHKLVRTHNIEHDYYRGLQKASENRIRKMFYALESWKLRRYEVVLKQAEALACISPNDVKYYSGQCKNVHFIPAFHSLTTFSVKPGKGNYFLYHGNLAVEENSKAVLFLLNQVFSQTNEKLIVTGRQPGKAIIAKVKQLSNVEIIANPPEEKLSELLENAHCCILPTFQPTGMKLKLLISLFASKHVLVNAPMVENTGLESLCEVALTENDFIRKINSIKKKQFSYEMIAERRERLKVFTNDFNGTQLIKILSKL